jgi:hypothetical protein
MTYGVIEELKFAVEVFDEGGNLIEVLARLRDLDAARAAYQACRVKYPLRLLCLVANKCFGTHNSPPAGRGCQPTPFSIQLDAARSCPNGRTLMCLTRTAWARKR